MEIEKKTLFERMQVEKLTPEQIQEWYNNNKDHDDIHIDDGIATMIFAAGALEAIDKMRTIA